jgi:hypothetical protein
LHAERDFETPQALTTKTRPALNEPNGPWTVRVVAETMTRSLLWPSAPLWASRANASRRSVRKGEIMRAHLRRLVVCSLAAVAVAVGYAGDAHAAPPPGVVFGCMNGSWSTSSREGVGSFSSEGECITYVMQGGTVFRLQSWNDTYVSYLGFNEAGSIIAISISNTSPSTRHRPVQLSRTSGCGASVPHAEPRVTSAQPSCSSTPTEPLGRLRRHGPIRVIRR